MEYRYEAATEEEISTVMVELISWAEKLPDATK
jgi:hypothetical protein